MLGDMMFTYADTSFLQMFLWERFKALSPEPHKFSPIEMVETVVRGVQVEKPNRPYQARANGWTNVKQNNNKNLSKVINVEKN